MTSRNLPRALTAALALAASVALVPSSATAHHAGAEPGPVHAGNTYGWWNRGIVWREEFETPYSGPTGQQWQAAGPGQVVHQNGMLTLNTASEGSVSATLDRPGAEVGRWETRLRSRRYGHGAANYRVTAELVPAGDAEGNCGARNIALESYKIGAGAANVYARNLPATAFRASHGGMDLGRDRWHTYAVEVTRERISWFIDAHVVYTERRPEAFSGVPLTVRFTMDAKPGKAMNASRMQMDWVRHWSLEAPDTLPVDAPPTRLGSYGKAC